MSDFERQEFNRAYPITSLLNELGFNSTLNDIVNNKIIYENQINCNVYLEAITDSYGNINLINVVNKHSEKLVCTIRDPFDFYCYFYCNSDINRAYNWRVDKQYVNYPSYPQDNFQKINYPLPTFNMYEYIHGDSKEHELNLHSHIPTTHILYRIASYIHKERPLPLSTLILVGLGVASGMTAKKWKCKYPKIGHSPICLYIVAENSSGQGKTFALDIFKKPLLDTINILIKKIDLKIKEKDNEKARIVNEGWDEEKKGAVQKYKEKIKAIENDIKDLEKEKKQISSFKPITRTTPEALEESLNNTNGFFLVASDEKSLIDSLILSKNKKSNVVLLNGRDAGDYHSMCVSRTGYNGILTGSFVMFAQKGPIKSIIEASDNTGLFERFLIASEPSIEEKPYDNEFLECDVDIEINDYENVYNLYAKKFDFLESIITEPLHYDELCELKISNTGWHHIELLKKELNNQRTQDIIANEMLITMIKKTDKQIMSIAANLYLLDLDDTSAPLENNNQIPDKYVIYAINIVRELVNGAVQYFNLNGYVVKKEYIKELIECFYDKKNGIYISMNKQSLIHKFEQRKAVSGVKKTREMTNKIFMILCQCNIILSKDNVHFFVNPHVLQQI